MPASWVVRGGEDNNGLFPQESVCLSLNPNDEDGREEGAVMVMYVCQVGSGVHEGQVHPLGMYLPWAGYGMDMDEWMDDGCWRWDYHSRYYTTYVLGIVGTICTQV